MKPIEVSGRRRYEKRYEDGDVPPDAEDLLDTEALMEKVWLDSMPRSAVNAIQRGDSRQLYASVSGNSAFGDAAGVKPIQTTAGASGYNTQAYSGLTGDNSIEDREALLISLYEVHDDLVSFFEKSSDTDRNRLNYLADTINKVSGCIEDLGGEKMQKFSAIDHVSGLSAPVLDNMAEKVINTTKNLYKGAKIEKIFEKDGAIIIVLSGEDNGVLYRTAGKIVPNHGWNGSEAIDYVYSKGSGKMSVKAYEANKWVDKSNSYEITWNAPHEVDTRSASAEDIEEFKRFGQAKSEPKQEQTGLKSDPDIDTNFNIEEKSSS
jgi:hypothetical protein